MLYRFTSPFCSSFEYVSEQQDCAAHGLAHGLVGGDALVLTASAGTARGVSRINGDSATMGRLAKPPSRAWEPRHVRLLCSFCAAAVAHSSAAATAAANGRAEEARDAAIPQRAAAKKCAAVTRADTHTHETEQRAAEG